MIKVYFLSVSDLAEETLFQAACEKADAYRLEKVKRAKCQEDKRLSAGAGLLLQYAVWESSAFAYECRVESRRVSVKEILENTQLPELSFDRGEGGKPYFKEECAAGMRLPFFSLSHSGAYVLCALADEEIGADIQQIPKADEKRLKREKQIARKCFTEQESSWCMQGTAVLQRERFYRIWAAKEAYMKLTGAGLAEGFSSFSADLEKAAVKKDERKNAFLQELQAPCGYTAALCIWDKNRNFS